jgi:hypothetical protein
MKSRKSGKSISDIEVQNISKFGLWLFVKGKEYFLPFENFPWFKKAKISEIYSVKLLHGRHLRWPKLDVDLELESLANPEKYPHIYR